MRISQHGKSGVHGGGGFSFRESDGTMTKLYMIQGLDMVMEQRRPGQKPVYVSTYSDPGSQPYAVLLKFLHLNNIRFPTPPRERSEKEFGGSLPFENSARFAGMDAVLNPFPMRVAGRLHETIRARFVQDRKPFLEFETQEGKMRVSLALAQGLAQHIPEMYKGFPVSFRTIQTEIHRLIRKEGFEPYKKSVIEQRKPMPKPIQGRQLEFPFMRGKKKVNPKSPSSRRRKR